MIFPIRRCLAVLVVSTLTVSSRAQSAAAGTASPAFEVADVHPSPSRLHPNIDGSFKPDRVVLRDATVTDLISIAYRVDPADILGGPAWLDFDRFDINGKPPAGARISNEDNDPTAAALLRALLADRFALVARVEQRPLPGFVLTVGKANLMKPAADPAANTGCQYQQQTAGSSGPSLIHFSCRNVEMGNLAGFLHDVGSPYFNRPVVDQTGLKGGWDFDLAWSYNKPTTSDGISLPDALLKQLGLKVESKPVPTPVVVIQSLSQKPTPNVANIDALLPPPPPKQFDVAVVHEANPGEKHFNIDVSGRHVNVQYATLLTLIYKSFDTPPNNIRNQPKWLDDVHYDIIGTVASSGLAPAIPGHEDDIDYEDIKEMVRSLLADRFKLATHMGTEPATVFALTPDSPKMKLAAETEHPACEEGPGPDGKDLRIDNPMRDRLISCQHMTMAQFAVELHRLASGYVPAPVVDSTGLPGAYDFSLSFSRANKLRAPASAPSVGNASTPGDSDAADPGGGLPPISLFDAMQKQLGLKLVKKDSVPQSVLVIDHVEEHPTAN